MAGVKLEEVKMTYGGLVALDNISFECEEGEFFTLLGPSGAGKTTTLELIAGIKQPSRGLIYIGGRVVNDLAPDERDVAMAFENYALYPHLSVYENVSFPLRAPRRKEELTPTQERAKVQEIATLLGIDQLLDRKPQQLSGGQKQRVSLARAMVRNPKVYLLDEPIAHLDAKLKVSARSTLKQLAYKLGITILYVTHDYHEALGLSDRVLALRKGRIEQIGTPEEMYESPASDFVARLMGDPPVNLVDGEIVNENGKMYFQADADFRFPLSERLVFESQRCFWQENGRKMVRIGLRPKHMRISFERLSDESFQLPVYVCVREAKSTVITFELKNCFFQGMVDNNVRLGVGEKVWVDIDQNKLFVFRKSLELTK
jgi:multiple sugar transport system ATP-binding protein